MNEIHKIEQNLTSESTQDQLYLLQSISKLYWGRYPQKSIQYAQKALDLSLRLKDKKAQAVSLRLLGAANKNIGEYDQAMEYFHQSLILCEELNLITEKADLLNNIAILESSRGRLESAVKYYHQVIELYEQAGEMKSIAIPLGNIGIIYSRMGLYDKALEYYTQSLVIREKSGDESGKAVSLNLIAGIYNNKKEFEKAINYAQKALKIRLKTGNSGDLAKTYQTLSDSYKQLKKYSLALEYANKALTLKKKLSDQNGLSIAYQQIGEILFENNQIEKSIDYFNQALKISKKLKISTLLMENNYNLSKSYESLGNYLKAYHYLKEYLKINEETIQLNIRKISLFEQEKQEKELELVKKDSELKSLKMRTLGFIISGLAILILLIAVFLYFFIREKRKSEKLLLNILPKKVALELKQKGFSLPEKFDEVTVFFSDMVHFTQISSQLDPVYLINELNEIFTAFDDIMSKFGCQRIKTIGDAYLAVCGIPEKNNFHAEKMACAALEIVQFLENRKLNHLIKWQARIGLHSGSLVGGIVGVKKYIYDIFGDTVNTASRMEHASLPMKINVSQSTYLCLKDQFDFSEKRTAEVKGLGELVMYFLEKKKKRES